MRQRLMGIVVFIAGALLLAGLFWELPYPHTISLVCALICIAYGLFEALRPDPRGKN